MRADLRRLHLAREQVVPDGAPHATHAVAPADLLALGVVAAEVRDRHLVDPPAGLRDLRRDLGLEAEAALPDYEAIEDLDAECLVAGPDVREIDVRQHVGEQRQQPVPDRVPEEEHAVRAAAKEARAEDDVGEPALDRVEEPENLARVVLEIRILHDDELTADLRESAAEGRALPGILLLEEDPHAARG